MGGTTAKKAMSSLLKAVLLLCILLAIRVEFFAGGYFNWWILYLFTTQSNILVFFVLLWLLVRRKKEFSSVGAIAAGTALLAITLTGIVYACVIYPLWQHGGSWGEGVYSWSRIATHIAVPVGYITNWLFFEHHGSCRWSHLFLWAAYPAVYGGIMIKKGLLMYEFMSRLSGLALVCALFLAIGGLYIGLDKLLSRKNKLKSRRQRRQESC